MGSVALEGFGGGGGASLNFKVVGNPQPTSPKENTIWVDTDEKITSWAFIATEPEDPQEGMVWGIISTSSTVAYNALKKNGIQVYPISAKQYVSGAWVTKTAKIYQGGEWRELGLYLFNNGNVNLNVTGGLKGYAYGNINSGSVRKNPTVTYSATSVTLTVNKDSDAGHSVSTLFAENPIFLSGMNTIKLNVTQRRGISGTIDFGVTNIKSDNFNRIARTYTDSTGLFSLDISALEGDYYLFIEAGGSGDKSITFDLWALE